MKKYVLIYDTKNRDYLIYKPDTCSSSQNWCEALERLFETPLEEYSIEEADYVYSSLTTLLESYEGCQIILEFDSLDTIKEDYPELFL